MFAFGLSVGIGREELADRNRAPCHVYLQDFVTGDSLFTLGVCIKFAASGLFGSQCIIKEALLP